MTTALILDGHDASGKTTLSRRLADALGAALVRPFAGAVGQQMLTLTGDPPALAAFARDAIAAAAARAGGAVQVFDRHWMTVCSLLPESLWSEWQPAPPTVLCWADLPTTLARLAARDTDEPEEPTDEHARYLALYDRLGRVGSCLVVRTDLEPEERSLARLVAWGRSRLDRGGG